jgi:predicted translin family RNA/ssDNA-binding protein
MKNEIPENVKEKLESIRSLHRELNIISYKMGTNGERGLYRKLKSIRSQISKAKEKFTKSFKNYELIYTGDVNGYYIKSLN